MNLRSFDKCTRTLIAADLAAAGKPIPAETNNFHVVGILDCTQRDTILVQNLVFGIRQAGGIPLTFSLPNFTYHQKLMPATAKYAHNYQEFMSKSTAALVRSNMLDGLVALVDNNVMALGVLLGCTQTNCPVILMPTGVSAVAETPLLHIPGKVATREIKGTTVDQLTNAYQQPSGIAPEDTLTTNLFTFLEGIGFMLPHASELKAATGTTFKFAIESGAAAVQRTDDIITPKRLLNKKTLATALEQYQAKNLPASGIIQCRPLLEMVDLKLPNNLPGALKNSLADEAYVASESTAPLTLEGAAWVYRSLSDAMTALTTNAIENGVIVMQNCPGCDVSLIAHTVMALHKEAEIALVTDGDCAATPVLTITNISPSAFDNQDFANIQTGDQLTIDVAKGHLNTNVTSKDMKLRAKRNIVKKYEVYF